MWQGKEIPLDGGAIMKDKAGNKIETGVEGASIVLIIPESSNK